MKNQINNQMRKLKKFMKTFNPFNIKLHQVLLLLGAILLIINTISTLLGLLSIILIGIGLLIK